MFTGLLFLRENCNNIVLIIRLFYSVDSFFQRPTSNKLSRSVIFVLNFEWMPDRDCFFSIFSVTVSQKKTSILIFGLVLSAMI